MWLYTPPESCPSAPEPEDSSSESSSPSPDLVLWVTSSGKAMQRPLSWHAWKNRPWIKLLYGALSKPSMASRGAERWISSLRVFRASPGAKPGSEKGSRTSAGSGPRSSASFGKFDRDGSFWKTSLDLFQEGASDPSSVTWPYSGSMRNGVVSEREMWAPHTNGRGSSSSGSPWDRNEYPTPTGQSYGTGQNEGQVPHQRPTAGTPSLETGMRRWPTPQEFDSRDFVRDPKDLQARREERPEWKNAGGRNLKDETAHWPTPTQGDGQRGGSPMYRGEENPSLGSAAQGWPTPNTKDGESAARHTTDPENPMHPGTTLTDATRGWPTPSARDWKGDRTREETGDPADLLDKAAERWGSPSFHPDQMILRCGDECSPKHRRLNPRFVEWLMAWPGGWSFARIGSGCSATEFTRYKRRWRSYISWLVPELMEADDG